MGQAQRSDGRNVPRSREEGRQAQYPAQRRRKQAGTGNRTKNAYRSSARNGISVIGGCSGGERARRRTSESDGLENLELWEISRENDNSHMMRLADRGQVRSGRGVPPETAA